MEFPVLFLGALPKDTPALYSLMNYADIRLGTWYPQGGMNRIVDAMYALATELGVQFQFNEKVTAMRVDGSLGRQVITEPDSLQDNVNKHAQHCYDADVFIGAADYHHIEAGLLPPGYQSYSEKYWDSRVMAPSCLLYYVGLNKKLTNLVHHSLFFDVDFERHGEEIYTEPKWPLDPLFYVSATSVSDPSVAPDGCENLFFLIPVATGLQGDDEEKRVEYFEQILTRFENKIGESVKDAVIYKRSYSLSDFKHDYNAYKGNAYGLANTLSQTAILKPGLRSKKITNLFYAGQLTVPGPGVPPSLISGEVTANLVLKHFR